VMDIMLVLAVVMLCSSEVVIASAAVMLGWHWGGHRLLLLPEQSGVPLAPGACTSQQLEWQQTAYGVRHIKDCLDWCEVCRPVVVAWQRCFCTALYWYRGAGADKEVQHIPSTETRGRG
jgi:hypothetical protein